MFTGYVGLRFEHFLFGTCEIVKLNDKCVLFEQVPYIEENPIVGNCFLGVMEQYLNNQGKAPKHIQYEIVLNTCYSYTTNAIDWIDGKYYLLDACIQGCNIGYSTFTESIYYAPACKLPTRYLPTQLGAKRYLDKVWGGESCYLGDTYWESMPTDTDLETVYNYVDVCSVNEVLFSNADWECGDGIGGGNCGELPHTMLHIYTKALAMPLPKNHNTSALTQSVVTEQSEIVHDGDLLTDTQYTQLIDSVYCQMLGVALVIDGDEYITTHQLDLTHYPILQPPAEEFSTVSNIIYKHECNAVMYSDNFLIYGNGEGNWYGEPSIWLRDDNVVVAPCCNLFK